MKKIAFVLSLALLLPLMASVAVASGYGAETNKLLITHIDANYAGHEGTGIVYTSSKDGTIAPYGSFDWWYVAVFEWNSNDKCYAVSKVVTTLGTSKSTTKIPENGFVYCCNTGNDYPSLGDNSKPNYKTDAINDTCAYIAKLKKGDKVYLYGTDLINATVDTNEELWYTKAFESNAYIKIGSEDKGKTAYNPELASEKAPEIKLGINAINTSVTEGQSMLLTPAYGNSITAKNNGYSWCRTAVFDWSPSEKAYVVISVDTSVGNGMQKNAIIPPNGFAISVNTGNNYPALGYPDKPNYVNKTATNTYEALGKLKIGTKVYLEGINLAKNSFEYEGNLQKYYSSSDFKTKAYICITDTKPSGCYEPNTSDMLITPDYVNKNEFYTQSDIKIEWKPVTNADKYFVAVLDGTINTNGEKVVYKEVTETSITIPSSQLTVGSKYTINVYAIGKKGSSPVAYQSFVVCSDRALNSKFKNMTVVAFGDSITAWKGWVAMLYGQLGTEVINAGVGGDRTVQALARIDDDVIAHDPDLVIVNFGMNDQAVDSSTNKNLTPIDQYEKNYRTIIEKIKATGSKIILVAVHDVCNSKYGGGSLAYNKTDAQGVGYVDRYNEVVKKLANEYKLGFLDINSLAEKQLDSIILDGIHLNDLGQKKYCEWISNYCFEYIGNDETPDESTPETSESDESDTNESQPEESSTEISTDGSADESSAEISTDGSADENEQIQNNESNAGDSTAAAEMPAWQVALIAILMFTVISVIGVMFIKTIKKNK